MSRQKKQRTAKNFLGRKYGKKAFKTGSKKDGTTPSTRRGPKQPSVKKARPKSLYQKFLESNPEAKKTQQRQQATATKKALQQEKEQELLKAQAEEQALTPEALSDEERALNAIEQDPKLRAIQKRLELGEQLSPDDADYLEAQMMRHQELIDQIEGEDDDLLAQFDRPHSF